MKPNEHEAEMLTGIKVTDFDNAQAAATKLHEQGVENILITAGGNGAFLFSQEHSMHIPIPGVKQSNERDETACGDQTMATLCASLQENVALEKAAERAVLAGTLQFYRPGVKPIDKNDLNKT